ncbi:MAG: hypothetical protein ACI81L_001526 [Verrucomicrobiales bacterium]|jgi:hypothetical protein
MARHPSQEQLASWLNGAHSHFDAHIDSCARCAKSLDEIDISVGSNVEALTAELRPALLTLLQPPKDLHERISGRIAARLQDRNDADLMGSLLGVPIEMSRIFFEAKLNEDSSRPSSDT